MLSDLRYAFRTLAHTPAFTTVAVIVLALGIGANSAIFSVIDAVLLRPLPYRDPGQLAMLWQRFTAEVGGGRLNISPPEYVEYRARATSIASMGAGFQQDFNLTDGDEPERVHGALVTSSLLGTLGVRPLLGRIFTAADEARGAPRIAVLSYGLWQRRFGGDPQIVGKTYKSGGLPVTVVGVMPASFRHMNAELWRPLGFTEQELANRSSHFLDVVVRLKPGVTLQTAQADVQRAGEEFGARRDLVYLNPLDREIVGDVRPVLLVLAGAVTLVLLIACANVANLLLTRGAGRQRELAVRAALGAGRGRLVRQLLAESVTLSLLGAAVGLLFALWAIKVLRVAAPAGLPRLEEIGVDTRALAFTLGLALLTGLVFGAAPALHGARADLAAALGAGGGRAAGSVRHRRVRWALVVAELAFSLMLLVGAGLLVRTVIRLYGVRPGIDASSVLTFQTVLPFTRFPDARAQTAFFDRSIEQVKAIPGVRSAAVVSSLPFTDRHISSSVMFRGRGRPEGGFPEVEIRSVSPEFFRTMGIRLERGRLLDNRDRPESPRAVVINETMARRWYPGADPVGQHLTFFVRDTTDWREIVGVVSDIRNAGLARDAKEEIYAAFSQQAMPEAHIVVRAAANPGSLANAVRGTMRTLDPTQPIFGLRTMEAVIDDTITRERFSMLVLGIFSAVALLLAMIGTYGVVSYSVAQQSREIGIRRALGAQRRDVMALVVSQGARVTMIGLALGIGGALLLTRVLSRLLYGVTATDPVTFAVVTLLLGAVALAATYIPARRAATVDPMQALRADG
jgi:putative ABC transport system permease protein